MRLPIEYWKNTLSKLGVRVERRRVRRKSVEARLHLEQFERRQMFAGDMPEIAGFVVSPALVNLGSQITLTATSVTDPNGDAISEVRFYRDADSDNEWTVADGSPIGIDTSSADGWSIAASTATFPGGTNRFFAIAKDSTGLDSIPVSATNTILLPPTIIDNGGTGYATVSNNYWSTTGGGYGGGYQFEFGATNGYAQWTFASLPAGEYRVSATWPASTSNGTKVPYTVFDGTLDVGGIKVNQRVAPEADVVVGGKNFEDLGLFSVVNGSLVVRVTNSSGDGRAIADAIRLEHVGPAQEASDIRVFDGGAELYDAASTVDLGTTFYGTPSATKTLTVKNVGLTDLVLTPLTQASMPAGIALVSSYASTTLARGTSTTFQVRLDATSTGAVSGVLALASNDPDESSFDITLSGVVNATKIVDNSSATGYTTVSSGYWSSASGGYSGGHQFEFGSTGGYAEWTFPNLPAGEYRVSATWLEGTNRGTNVPYTVYDGSYNLGAVPVNQRVAPAADVVVSGKKFQNLGSFSAVNGSLVVRITNSSGDGRAIADAIRIEHLGPAQNLPEIRVFNGGTELFDNTSTVDLGTTFYGTPAGVKTLTVTNSGTTGLVLTPLTQGAMPAGVTLVSSYASTTLAPGASTTFQVQLAATSTGTVGGTLSLVSNDADETSFDLALTGVVQSVKIIDNGDVGYSTVSSNYWSTTAGYQFEFGATGGYAEWNFQNLPAGEYRVFATWVDGTNHGTAVPYTISDGGFAVSTVKVNQRLDPEADVTSGGKKYQDLGSVSVVNGSVVVRLTNSSLDGRAIADSIRLEHVGDLPEVRFTPAGGELLVAGSPATTVDFGESERTQKAIEVIEVTNTTGSTITLTQVQQQDLPSGYLLLEGLGALSLAAGASTYLRVQLDAVLPGTYSGIIPIQTSGGSFNLPITGEAIVTPVLVDNGDAGFVTTGTGWQNGPGGQGFEGDYQKTSGAASGKTASWTIEGLAAGAYLVYTTYLPSAANTAAALFKLYDGTVSGGTLEQQGTVNQQLAPEDLVVSGKGFGYVGQINVNSTTLTVELDASNLSGGLALADAVYIVPATLGSFFGFSSPGNMVTGSAESIKTGFVDPDGELASAINLYRDTNSNGVLDVGVDQLVSSDSSPLDGFGFDASTLATGTHEFFVAAMSGSTVVASSEADVTAAEWWRVEIVQYRTDGEREFTTIDDLVADPRPVKLAPSQTWIDAVYARVCGTVTTFNTWEPNTYYYSFPKKNDDGTYCVPDDNAFDVDTQSVLKATWANHDLSLADDTRMIVLEDLTRASGNDLDYDDQYWIVEVTPYDLPKGEVFFGIEEEDTGTVTVATLDWTNDPISAGDIIATIDWGDGTWSSGTVTGSGSSFTVEGSHTYPQEGPYGVVVMFHIPQFNYVMFAGSVGFIENVLDEESPNELGDHSISGSTTESLVPTLHLDYEEMTFSLTASGGGEFDFGYTQLRGGTSVFTHKQDDGKVSTNLMAQGKFSVSLTPYCPCDDFSPSISDPLMTTSYSLTATGTSGFEETYDTLSSDVEDRYNLTITDSDISMTFSHTKTASFSSSTSTYSWSYGFTTSTYDIAEDGRNQTDRESIGEIEAGTRQDARNFNRRLANGGEIAQFTSTGDQSQFGTLTETGSYSTRSWERESERGTHSTVTITGTNQTESYSEDRRTSDSVRINKYAQGMTESEPVSYSLTYTDISRSTLERESTNQTRDVTRTGTSSVSVVRNQTSPDSNVVTVTSATTSNSSFRDVETNGPLTVTTTMLEQGSGAQTQTLDRSSDYQTFTGTLTTNRTQYVSDTNQGRVISQTMYTNETRTSSQEGKVSTVSYTLTESTTGGSTLYSRETNQTKTITGSLTSTFSNDQTTYQTSEDEFTVTQSGSTTSTLDETETNQSMSIDRQVTTTKTDSFYRFGTAGESASPYTLTAHSTAITDAFEANHNQGRLVTTDNDGEQTITVSETGDASSTARTLSQGVTGSSTLTRVETNQDLHAYTTVTSTDEQTVHRTSNEITGSYTLTSNGSTTTTNVGTDTNQLRNINQNGDSTLTFESSGNGNSVAGDSTMTQSDWGSSTLTRVETNQDLTISSTIVSTDTSTNEHTGNEISGSFTLTATTTSKSTASALETNQTQTIDSTQSNTGTTTTTRTGNSITGSYTLSGSDSSNGSFNSTESNQTRTVVSSGTTNSSVSSEGDGNSIVTTSTVTTTGTSSSSATTTETNQDLTIETTQSNSGSNTTTRSGNEITGIYSLTGDESSNGSFDSTETNQTRTVTRGGTNDSEKAVTEDGNSVKTDSTVTVTGTSSSTVTSTETNQGLTIESTQSNSGSSTSTRTANAITGTYTLTGNDSFDGSFDSTETNQTRTVVSSGTNGGSSTTNDKGNAVIGESTVTSTGSTSSTVTSTETNQDLTIDSTIASAGSNTQTHIGNSITGSFTLTVTSTSGSTVTALETNQTRAVDSTQTSSDSNSSTRTGNSITGTYTLSGSNSSNGSFASSETNQTRTVVSSGTSNSSGTIKGDGNSVVTSGTVTNTGTNSSSMTSTETNQDLTIASTQTNNGSNTTTRSGNEITGIYSFAGDDSSSGTFGSTETNQSRTVASSGTNDGSSTLTENGNSVRTTSTVTSTGTSSSTVTSTESNQDLTIELTQSKTGSSTSTRTGNDITGSYTLTGNETFDGSFDSTETNKTRTVVSSGTSGGSSTTEGNGNSVLAHSTTTVTGTSSATITSTETNQSLTVESNQTLSGSSTSTQTGNTITGTYTATGTETSDVTFDSTETNQTRLVVSSGSSNSTITSEDSGNSILGDFESTQTTTGTNNSTSTETNPTKSVTQTSDGNSSQTRTEFGNRILGNYEGTSSYSTSAEGTIDTTHQLISANGTFSTIDTGSSEFSGHSISATYESENTSTVVRTQNEDLTNQSLTANKDEYKSTTVTETSSGNSILGDYESSSDSAGDFTITVTDSNNGLVVSATETGTDTGTSTSSGNEIIGDYTANSTVTRGSTTVKNSVNQGILVIDSTLTSDSTTTSDSSGNQILGDDETDSTTTTNSTLIEHAVNQTLVVDRTTTSDVTIDSFYSTNIYTGVFTSNETTDSESSLHQTDDNQTTAFATIDRVTTDNVFVESDGNDILGDVTKTTTSTSATVTDEIHTNQSQTTVQNRTDNGSRTTYRTENTFTGIYSEDTTGTSDFTLSQTHTNDQGLAVLTVVIDQIGTGTLVSEHESGNSVVGSYSRDTESLDSDTLTETDTNQVRLVSVTITTTNDVTTSQSGNRVTGDYTLDVDRETDRLSVETNTIDPFSTISVDSFDTSISTKIGNEIDGSYSLDDTTTSDSTFTEVFTNKTLTVNITEVSGGDGTRLEIGNAVAGTSDSTTTYTGTTSLERTDANQTLSVTIHELSESTSTTTDSRNVITGEYTTTIDTTDDKSSFEESTNQTKTVSIEVFTDSTSTTTDIGNAITGLYDTVGNSSATIDTTERTANKTQTVWRYDNDRFVSTTTEGSGNSILMSSDILEITTMAGVATEIDTNQSLTVTGTETYSSTSTFDRSASAITGLYTEITTSDGDSTVVELSLNQTRTVDLTRVSDSTSVTTKSGNSITGDYDLSSTATANENIGSVETNQSLTVLASQSSTIVTTEEGFGSDRYEDFETTITTTITVSTGRAETNQSSVTVQSRFATGESTQVRSGNYVSGTYLETSNSSDDVTLYHVAVNQTSTDSLFQVDTSTTTGSRTGNLILGDYTLTSTTDLAFEIEQQDDNTSQAIDGTNTGTEASTLTGSGNDITGLYANTVIGVDTTANDQSGTIGDRTFTLTETSSRTYTRTEDGDQIITESSMYETSVSGYTLVRSDTYVDGVDSKTITTNDGILHYRSGNAITGQYSQDRDIVNWTTISESGDRGNTYSLDSTGSSWIRPTEAGNSVTGEYSLTENSDTESTVVKVASQPLGGSFSVSHSTTQSSGSTTTGNYLTGDYALSGSRQTADQMHQAGSAASTSFAAGTWQSVSVTDSTNGNRITGLFSGTQSINQNTSDSQTGVNAGGTYEVYTNRSDNAAAAISGNEITGESTVDRTGSEYYWVSQSNTNGSNDYSLEIEGTRAYGRTTTASRITGETTETETGTDNYSLTQTGVDGLRIYTQTMSGEDVYTIAATSNDTADGLDKTISGTGTYSWEKSGTDDGVAFLESDSGGIGFGLEQAGTYVDGNLTITQSGTDRYDLLQQFNNPSTAVNGLPGTVEFSPVGAMITVGLGVAPPTGGAGYGNGRVTIEGVSSALIGASGSQLYGNIRGSEAMGLTDLADGWLVSAASMNDAYNDLGRQLAMAYCFAAGTRVLMANGSYQAIETIQAGDRVLAVSERDPEGGVVEASVVEPYHNAPSVIHEIRVVVVNADLCCGAVRASAAKEAGRDSGESVGAAIALMEPPAPDELIRTTPNHPFYVRGRGWVKAKDLQVGDRFRRADGGDVEVLESGCSAAVEPVYNLHVAGAHTYFVVLPDSEQSVLVHNESLYTSADEAITKANQALANVKALQASGAPEASIREATDAFNQSTVAAQKAVNEYMENGWGSMFWGSGLIERVSALPAIIDGAKGSNQQAYLKELSGAVRDTGVAAGKNVEAWEFTYHAVKGVRDTAAIAAVTLGAVIAAPIVLTAAGVSAAGITAIGVGAKIVGAAAIGYGLGSSASARLQAGEGVGTAAVGAVLDVTQISKLGASIFNVDIASGKSLNLSAAERGTMFGQSIVTIGVGVAGSMAKGMPTQPKPPIDKSWKLKIHGRAQKTGTDGHQFRTYREAIKEAKKADVVSVHLDHGYNRGLNLNPKTISPNRRPDVLSVYKDRSVARVEVKSKTDDPTLLYNRNAALDAQLRAQGFRPLPPRVVTPTASPPK